MNPAVRAFEVLTRPWVVLLLRVGWDFTFGVFLLLAVQGILAVRDDVQLVGLLTIGAGAWTLTAEVRAYRTRRLKP